jgi:hypothetical protein
VFFDEFLIQIRGRNGLQKIEFDSYEKFSASKHINIMVQKSGDDIEKNCGLFLCLPKHISSVSKPG